MALSRVMDVAARVISGLVVGGSVMAMTSGLAAAADTTTVSESCGPSFGSPSPRLQNSYNRLVVSYGPAMYLTLGHTSGTEIDLSGHGHAGVYLPRGHNPRKVRLPNGDLAALFNGRTEYLQVGSSPALSPSYRGCLTINIWFLPTTLQFPRTTGSGYVYLFGKGAPGKQEYALRLYALINADDPARPNRISAYVFNLRGGKGSGSYFQDVVHVDRWIMVTMVVMTKSSASWPHGFVAIYKDGRLRDRVSLDQFGVTPQASDAPFRIATRQLDSYFEGAIGKVAVYDSVLSNSEILNLYRAMFHRIRP